MRVCKKCGKEKPLTTEFYELNRRWFRTECRSCRALYQSCKNREINKHNARVRYWKDPDKFRMIARERTYNIRANTFYNILESQNNTCAICYSEHQKMCIDHCHSSQIIRGIICDPCNKFLGLMDDDIKKIQNLINYLTSSPTRLQEIGPYSLINQSKRQLHDRQKSLKSNYGITIDDYLKFLQYQNGKCAICHGLNSNGKYLSVDHCHASGQIRGLLCQKCNAALGMIKDNPLIAIETIAYLSCGINKWVA